MFLSSACITCSSDSSYFVLQNNFTSWHVIYLCTFKKVAMEQTQNLFSFLRLHILKLLSVSFLKDRTRKQHLFVTNRALSRPQWKPSAQQHKKTDGWRPRWVITTRWDGQMWRKRNSRHQTSEWDQKLITLFRTESCKIMCMKQVQLTTFVSEYLKFCCFIICSTWAACISATTGTCRMLINESFSSL